VALVQAATSLLRASEDNLLTRLSRALREIVPHAWAAISVRGRVCSTADRAGNRTTPPADELARLAERAVPGRPFTGSAVLAGALCRVAVFVSSELAATGCVLLLVDPVPTERLAVAEGMWDLAVTRLKALRVLDDVGPIPRAPDGLFAAREQAKALTALKDTHAATLLTLLTALRSRRNSDASARAIATAIASKALTDLRTPSLDGEIAAGDAFAMVGERLRALAKHTDVSLELAAPADPRRLIAPPVFEAARAIVGGSVLSMIEHIGPDKVRVAWQVSKTELTIDIRANGDVAAFPHAIAEYRLRERVDAFGGRFTAEAVPGWGSRVTATIPLSGPRPTSPHQLPDFSARELEVFNELAQGRTNTEIAERLHVTVHTVKFHVSNILAKLGASTRGEAAAIAREARL
jgi:DNA-binding CsgD family transcriptional regulator